MTLYSESFDIYKIKPKNINKSDKYSANLYKYFKENPNSRVFKSKNVDNRSATKILIGEANEEAITGTTLNHILTDNFNKWYMLYSEYGEYEDFTETFINEYIRIGRCVWDEEHSGWMRGDDNRFNYNNENERICNWCGEVQRKKEVLKIDYEWGKLHEINLCGENNTKSKHPFKVYSITKDGNNNEVEVFEGAFETLDKVKEYRPNHSDYHKLLIEVEDDK